MEFTGVPELDLKIIRDLDYEGVIKLLDRYDENIYSLVLTDYKTRPSSDEDPEEYKGQLYYWFINNSDKIPNKNFAEIMNYLIENSESNDVYSIYDWALSGAEADDRSSYKIAMNIMDYLIDNIYQKEYTISEVTIVLSLFSNKFTTEYILEKVREIIKK